jgi:NAD(P)-dependent dehydrogenase (short-subunit alcohol dehydrogenase family)
LERLIGYYSSVNGLGGKCVVAAGAGGIGSAVVARLAAEGATVVVGDVSIDAANEAVAGAEKAGGRALAFQFDIAAEASVEELIQFACAELGTIDGLFNVAADVSAEHMDRDTDAVDVPLEIWQRTIDVNLTGFLLTTRHVVPVMIEGGGGSIVNTISAVAFYGEPTRVSYGVTKAGLTALTRHVARRWGKDRIRCNAIAPGFVLTDTALANVPEELLEPVLAQLPTHRHGRPDDIASMAAFLLSDDAEWVTGQSINVDGGFLFR